MPDTGLQLRRHHMMVAGTGRAGTTFLVRYLSELGLSTTLQSNAEATIDPYCHAGLEELPLSGDPARLPYVIKSPWLVEYIDMMMQRVELDAVIIPVRDLADAASSRLTVERDAMHRSTPWLADHGGNWSSWGWTPGGVTFSLEPGDQMRVLAVGFHDLVERLVREDVPVIFVAFPRMIADPAYLFRKLAPVLPPGTTLQTALAAHGRIADASLVHVTVERSAVQGESDVERIALHRQLRRLRRERELLEASRTWRLARRLQCWYSFWRQLGRRAVQLVSPGQRRGRSAVRGLEAARQP